MRITTGFLPFLLTMGALPALATPTYYIIDFTVIAGTPALAPTSGSFFYDSSSETFTGFSVVWDGTAYDLSSAANSPTIGPYGTPACASGSGGGASFNLLTACQTGPNQLWTEGACCTYSGVFLPGGSFGFAVGGSNQPTIGFVADGVSAGTAVGQFTVESAPEPSTIILVGIGLCLVMRRRIAAGARRFHIE